MTPVELEKLIEAYRVIGTWEPDRDRQCAAFSRMAELIELRSPEQRAAMEAKLPRRWGTR